MLSTQSLSLGSLHFVGAPLLRAGDSEVVLTHTTLTRLYLARLSSYTPLTRLQSLSISADVPPRFAALMLAEEESAADVPDIWAAAVEHAAARMSAITGQECNELAVKIHVAICE